MTQPVFFSVIQSPVGALTLTTNGAALTGVYFDDDAYAVEHPATWTRNDDALQTAATELAEYFTRKRTAFTLALSMQGTDFQKRVWQALTRIPHGTTMSYGDVASRIGAAGSARAIGRANGRNPIAIIVPCHRVIGADGSLTGYGGGEWRKKWLLEFEWRASRRDHSSATSPMIHGETRPGE